MMIISTLFSHRINIGISGDEFEENNSDFFCDVFVFPFCPGCPG